MGRSTNTCYHVDLVQSSNDIIFRLWICIGLDIDTCAYVSLYHFVLVRDDETTYLYPAQESASAPENPSISDHRSDLSHGWFG